MYDSRKWAENIGVISFIEMAWNCLPAARLLLDNEKYYLDKDNDKIKILLLLGKKCCQKIYLLDKVSRYFI